MNNRSSNERNTVLFDSFVDNEKEYLRKILNARLKGESHSENGCVVFFNWLVKQFETIKIQPPSPTLIYNLEFLDNTHRDDLLDQNGSPEKYEEYLRHIELAEKINYEDESFDPHALASASRDYIHKSVCFFDSETVNHMKEVYRDGEEDGKKREFFIERLPFIMNNRSVFRFVKKIASKSSPEKADSDWADAVIPGEIGEGTRKRIFRDLIKAEFDMVPLSFYD